MNNTIYEIDEREESTMVSNWTSYLCVSVQESGISLCHMRRAVLGSTDDYLEYDDEGELINDIPEEIDGLEVFGEEDGIILGYDLHVDNELDSLDISFTDMEFKNSIIDFLKDNDWDEGNLDEVVGLFNKHKP